MALNGIRQIKSITLRYCHQGGSSRGMREFLLSEARQNFEKNNSFVEIKEFNRANKHPIVIAEYQNGYQMQIDARNNTLEEIMDKLSFVVNKRPHSRTWQEKHRHTTQRPSIQGPWHPDQWLPLHAMKEKDLVGKE